MQAALQGLMMRLEALPGSWLGSRASMADPSQRLEGLGGLLRLCYLAAGRASRLARLARL